MDYVLETKSNVLRKSVREPQYLIIKRTPFTISEMLCVITSEEMLRHLVVSWQASSGIFQNEYFNMEERLPQNAASRVGYSLCS